MRSEELLHAKSRRVGSIFGLTSIRIWNGNKPHQIAVSEEAISVAPFGTLLHLKKEGVSGQPRVLLAAPMAGHYAWRLRETARTMLTDHDVYITNWHDARDVPLTAGRFGIDDYAQYLITFLKVLGPSSHLVAICQSCVAALIAAAIMAEDDDTAQPRSLTLMAGPIDTRVNPTAVNRFAVSTPIEWCEKNLIGIVPPCYAGAGRRVYPGFLQFALFMNTNLERHALFFEKLYRSVSEGGWKLERLARAWYEEYFEVMDLTAEFYLETVRHVFQEHALARGKLEWCGRIVRPASIRHTALLTIEGEYDDICAPGQTVAAHGLCGGRPDSMKLHHMQNGVGHEGLFRGQRWTSQIYPLVRGMIYATQYVSQR
jgi:poly(3-hydroxybutyrate) depolymerase